MNTEVTAVVEEKEKEEKREASCTECVVVELGVVSKDTMGVMQGFNWDGGFNWRF